MWAAPGPLSAGAVEGISLAQHHVGPGGAVELGGLWVRLLTMVALVVVAVVGVLALAPDPATGAAVLPVVLVTTALAMLPVVDWTRRDGVSGYLAGTVGVLALVLGTEPAAVGELLSGDWSGAALRAGAPVWVAALAWLALAAPPRPVSARAVWVVGFVVATGVVAAVPGVIAASGGDATAVAGILLRAPGPRHESFIEFLIGTSQL